MFRVPFTHPPLVQRSCVIKCKAGKTLQKRKIYSNEKGHFHACNTSTTSTIVRAQAPLTQTHMVKRGGLVCANNCVIKLMLFIFILNCKLNNLSEAYSKNVNILKCQKDP